MAKETKATLQTDALEAVADHGYFNGEEILACEEAGITVTLPKPMTSGIKAKGRFGKQDFVYLPEADVYRCPAGKRLKYYYTNVENGLRLRRYWTNACRTCALKSRCTTGVLRRITRWEHEHVIEAVQRRLHGAALNLIARVARCRTRIKASETQPGHCAPTLARDRKGAYHLYPIGRHGLWRAYRYSTAPVPVL